MIRFYDHVRKAYTSSIKINNETFFFSYSGVFSALAEWLMLCYGCLPSTQEHPFRFEPISPRSPR